MFMTSHGVVQSCRRNLSTIGKPVVIPGLPELAGLVGQITAQYEARMQQQAMQVDTDDATADATNNSPDAETDLASDAAATHDQAIGKVVTSAAEEAEVAAPASISGGADNDGGAAVDANADSGMPDAEGDVKALHAVPAVAATNDNASTVDAADARQSKKQKP